MKEGDIELSEKGGSDDEQLDTGAEALCCCFPLLG